MPAKTIQACAHLLGALHDLEAAVAVASGQIRQKEIRRDIERIEHALREVSFSAWADVFEVAKCGENPERKEVRNHENRKI